jgi:hypothetical protein
LRHDVGAGEELPQGDIEKTGQSRMKDRQNRRAIHPFARKQIGNALQACHLLPFIFSPDEIAPRTYCSARFV